MRRKFFILMLFVPLVSLAQEQKKVEIKFSGFVKNDAFFDTRRNNVEVRDGHFFLSPRDEMLDAAGEDINQKPTFNLLAIQTRLRAKITGPDAFGAKTSGYVEGEFFGANVPGGFAMNGFRLRHATATLSWKTTELMFGQYWHTMFVTGCFPGTISFNTGAPFQPFSRNPQIRLTKSFGKVKVLAAALTQTDFKNIGASIVNSAMPEMQIQLQYNSKNEEKGTEFLAGAGFGMKRLSPRSQSSGTDTTATGALAIYKSDESVNSMSFIGFLKCKLPKVTIKLEGIYGGNNDNLLMIGGYAVTKVTDPGKGLMEYTELRSLSAWTDIHTNGEKFQAGVFGGYSKNLGASEDIISVGGGRWANVEYMYRVSPRFVFISGKTKLATEVEYTVANYQRPNDDGTPSIDSKGVVTNSEAVANLRLLFSVIYSF